MSQYDAIIVGARCAGSPLAMLLAREGHRVLALERDTFPCDTLSTAFLQQGAVRRLQQWGLFDKFLETAPAAPRVQRNFWNGEEIEPNEAPDGSAHFSPRRALLDTMLADAARLAGAEVRTGVSVRSLVRDADGRVTGAVVRTASGEETTEEARIVIGADGRNSLVAREVCAAEYDEVAGKSCTYYSFYRGLPLEAMEVHFAPDHVVFSMPTHNGEVCLAIEAPAERYAEFRADPRAYAEDRVREFAPTLAGPLDAAVNTERWFGMSPRRSFFRVPFGPGWALAGDAGFLKDPVLGTGIDDAFRDAAGLAAALSAAFSGKASMDEALGAFHQSRDAESRDLYRLVCDFARMEGVTEEMLMRTMEYDM